MWAKVVWVSKPPWMKYLMYFVNDTRLCDTQKVIVALQWEGVRFKLVSSKILLLKLMLLDHGSHTTVQDHDPFF